QPSKASRASRSAGRSGADFAVARAALATSSDGATPPGCTDGAGAGGVASPGVRGRGSGTAGRANRSTGSSSSAMSAPISTYQPSSAAISERVGPEVSITSHRSPRLPICNGAPALHQCVFAEQRGGKSRFTTTKGGRAGHGGCHVQTINDCRPANGYWPGDGG